jgi:hypothetical protein
VFKNSFFPWRAINILCRNFSIFLTLYHIQRTIRHKHWPNSDFLSCSCKSSHGHLENTSVGTMVPVAIHLLIPDLDSLCLSQIRGLTNKYQDKNF